MIWALVNENNEVVNIILYDGVSPYTPDEGLQLVQVSDTTQIGDIL